MADNRNLNQHIMLQNSVSFWCLEMNVFSFKNILFFFVWEALFFF